MIYITGDTHGDIDFHKLNSSHIKEAIKEGDYVIICGDVAAVWDGAKQDKYIQKWYASKPWTTLFVDGNHENHDLLDTYPVTEWHGGKVHKINDKLIHLMRGQVFEIDGVNIFTMGGAESHDKHLRKEGRDWWAREMPSDAEYMEGLDKLFVEHKPVDIILSHCAPDHIQDKFAYGTYKHDKITNYLEVISKDIPFAYWFFGHYHKDWDSEDGKYHCLYNRIVPIKVVEDEDD